MLVTFCSPGDDASLACALAVAGMFVDRDLSTLVVHSAEHEKAVATWRAERTLHERACPAVVHAGGSLEHAQLVSMARAFDVALVVCPSRDRKQALEAADLVLLVWAGAPDDVLARVEGEVLEIQQRRPELTCRALRVGPWRMTSKLTAMTTTLAAARPAAHETLQLADEIQTLLDTNSAEITADEVLEHVETVERTLTDLLAIASAEPTPIQLARMGQARTKIREEIAAFRQLAGLERDGNEQDFGDTIWVADGRGFLSAVREMSGVISEVEELIEEMTLDDRATMQVPDLTVLQTRVQALLKRLHTARRGF